MKYGAFISHNDEDSFELSKAVVEMLKQRRVPAFRDADQSRTQHLADHIKEAINQSRRLVAILTKRACSSKWVNEEIQWGARKGKELIFCRHTEVSSKELDEIVQSCKKPFRTIEFSSDQDLLKALNKLDWGMPVIVPAAGPATGLSPLSLGMPKILFPVDDRPLLHHIVEKLDPAVFCSVTILTGPFTRMIEHSVKLLTLQSELPVECIRTGEVTIGKAMNSLALETRFLLHYADIFLKERPNWKDFKQRHEENESHGALGTLLVSQTYPANVGHIWGDRGNPGRISSLEEKPMETRGLAYVNMAVSVFEAGFMKYVKDEHTSIYGDSVRNAMAIERFAYLVHEHWRHIQTIKDWTDVQREFYPREF